MFLLLVVLGLIFLVGGAYLLVEGASRIAYLFGVSELVVGLTIVAIGTSAPELMVSIISAIRMHSGGLEGGSEIIIGNVVGSNIANIGLILGISALLATLAIPKDIMRGDFVWLLGASIVLGIFALNHNFTRLEGLILMAGTIAFSAFQYRIAMRQSQETADARNSGTAAKPENMLRSVGINLAMIAAGIVTLVFGSDWLIRGATEFAEKLGVSDYIIALTLVAVGTSLPELATSIVGTLRGEGDLVLGNIIGSNIYNILLILSAGMIITPLKIPDEVRTVQIPLMIGLTFAIYPLVGTNFQLRKREGFLLLVGYFVITGIAVALNPGG